MTGKWLDRGWGIGLLALAVSAGPVQARRVWPVVGASPGDVSLQAQCPAGQVLVGLSGRTGLWIDQVQLMCAAPLANGAFDEPRPGSDRLGGSGGGPRTATCDRGSRLFDAMIDLTGDAKKVASIRMTCVAPDGGQTTIVFGGSETMTHAVKKCTGITGCDPGEISANTPRQACPQEQFIGATVRFGKDVNAIGFICDGVATPSPASGRPIRLTGHPRL